MGETQKLLSLSRAPKMGDSIAETAEYLLSTEPWLSSDVTGAAGCVGDS